MTRTLIFALILCTLLQSCAKNDNTFDLDEKNLVPDEPVAVELPQTKIPLVSSIDNRHVIIQNGQEINGNSLLEKFEYDNKNRIISYDYNHGNFIYTYKYDVGNRVTEVVETTSTTVTTYQYNYYKDRIVVKSNREGFTIYLNDKKKIDKIMPYASNSEFIYNYDERGNFITKTYKNSREEPPYGVHTFDNMKNPFARVAGYNLHFQLIAPVHLVRESRGGTNNDTFADKGKGVSVGVKTYTYNADGYPLMSKSTYPNEANYDMQVYQYQQ